MGPDVSFDQRVSGGRLVSRYRVYDDGWCGPACALGLSADNEISEAALTVWIKPEEGGGELHGLEVEVEGRAPETRELPSDAPTEIRFACPRAAGEEAIVILRCSNTVGESGADLRVLSFVLAKVVLS